MLGQRGRRWLITKTVLNQRLVHFQAPTRIFFSFLEIVFFLLHMFFQKYIKLYREVGG